ncbi:MAG: PEP/pyruvate-binding domain-containing protein [Nitrospirota bacterium]
MTGLRSIFTRRQVCMPLINLQGTHVRKYRSFKSYLNHNHTALKIIADLEQRYYSGKPFIPTSIRTSYEELLEAVYGAIHSLESLSGTSCARLAATLAEIDNALSDDLSPRYPLLSQALVLPFEDITPELKSMVGAKAGNLAIIRNNLGVPAPHGFAVTAYAFERFIGENRLRKPIEQQLGKINPDSPEDMDEMSKTIRMMILKAELPQDLHRELMSAYAALEERAGSGIPIAMRSSAIGEDSEATFAGQYTSVLNVTRSHLIEAYKTVVAGKYSSRAISYRMHYGLDDRETPMCVAGTVMVDARASGVIYTGGIDPENRKVIRITSLWGLGERLVEGSASSDSFLVARDNGEIVAREISRKEQRSVRAAAGGTLLEEVPEPEQQLPSINDAVIADLARCSLTLENYFGTPQDIEWALDSRGTIVILQSRPLMITEPQQDREPVAREFPDHPLLLSGGQAASEGIAVGTVFMVKEGQGMAAVPDNAILVAKTASPHYANLAGRLSGIITDIGSITSHLSSVAREFGIPALVDTKNATDLLPDGETITLSASTGRVYKGVVDALTRAAHPARRFIFDTPVHRRVRRILDRIASLALIDPEASTFSPEGCKTLHDIVRFTHERAMQSMFGLTDEAEGTQSVELTAPIPLTLRLVDLGGGLRPGLTTCDALTPEHIESVPMRALWRGFTYPGITWEGTINLSMRKMMTLFASSAISEFGEIPGGTSYAVLSGDYLNLSAKFGYHFATLDAFCGNRSTQNYIALQFAGGAGNYYGKSLRVSFLGGVLQRLGFQVSAKGDLLEAYLTGYDRASTEDRLDRLGRLLACSRLLDMALSSQGDVERAIAAFFKGDYDLLSKGRADQLSNFYTYGGYWKRDREDDQSCCVQDGSKSGFTLSSGVAGIVGKFVGPSLQEFLDTIEAYYYFPLAIAKDSEMADGSVSVRVKPIGGHIDRAGGIAFGVRNASNYFVLRINALEDNVILFEYVNNKRIKRVGAQETIRSGTWYELKVEVSGNRIRGCLDGRVVVEHTAEQPVEGFVGLWTKADSVTFFSEITIRIGHQEKIIGCQ